MTTFLLLRHAHSMANESGILAGRIAGIELSEIGTRQSSQLNNALKDVVIDRIVISPLQRCKDTIAHTAKRRKKRIFTDSAFVEMDYGQWSGRSLKELVKEKAWKTIQKSPKNFTFPQGESFSGAAKRIERGLTSLTKKYPDETILIVTHGDVIKMALQLTHGGELNRFQNFVVDTCSLSELQWSKNSRLVVRSNVRLVKMNADNGRKSSIVRRKVLGGGSGV